MCVYVLFVIVCFVRGLALADDNDECFFADDGILDLALADDTDECCFLADDDILDLAGDSDECFFGRRPRPFAQTRRHRTSPFF